MLAARTVNYASAATPMPTVHRMGWASQANCAAVTSNVRCLGDRDQILTSKPCRWPPHRLFPNAMWGSECGPDQQRPALKPSVYWPITRAWVTDSELTAQLAAPSTLRISAYYSTRFKLLLHLCQIR
jgi:hypothetical protein